MPDTREFDLHLGNKVVIGRASKNSSRGHLLPAEHNMYIDSPVISGQNNIKTCEITFSNLMQRPYQFLDSCSTIHKWRSEDCDYIGFASLRFWATLFSHQESLAANVYKDPSGRW